mmetsp:Transcript_49821/g.156857  ORF Transcript_49821/g.156857 Transcript_49821/m.156857 type:complete len:432 (+) Transcript_49821:1558-2853(+)
MSAVHSPLLPLLAAAVIAVLPWAWSWVVAVVFVACSVRSAWLWWCRLSIAVDGVPFKEPSSRAGVRIQPARRAGPAEPAPAAAARKGGRHQAGGSPQGSGFVTPRDDDVEADDAEHADGLAAQGLTEWAPFAPSLPYGEQPPAPCPSPSSGSPAPGGAAAPPYWLECDASVFDVRNIRYKQTREKVSSEFALYDCVGMDMIRDKRRIDSLMDRLPDASASSEGGAPGTGREALPASPAGAAEWSSTWGVPRVLMVNCQMPYKAGRLIGAHPEDDGGLSVVAYFVLSRQSAELLSRGSLTPSLRLWRRFVEEGVSTKEGISLKAVGRVEDLEKYEVPESFGRFNNKPVLLTKSATVHTHRLPEILEIDYDVRGWVYLARSTLANYHHRAREAELEIGYLVEGKADDELPEQILGCFKLINMDITAAHWASVM